MSDRDEESPTVRVRSWRNRLQAAIDRVKALPGIHGTLAVVETAGRVGAPLFSAALAFTTMFAIIPVLLLLSGVLGWLIDDPRQRETLLNQLVSYVPPLADVLRTSLDSVVRERGALSIVGVIGLLWGSSSLYGTLDEVMRRVFPGGGVRNEIARRVRGVMTVLVLVALIVGAASLSSVWAFVGQLFGDLGVWGYVAPLISLGVMVVVVLAVYRLVPTSPPTWREALVPAIAAGIGIGLLTNLFGLLAPWLIGGLSGFGVVATVFGAFVWLNLSYQILLYGATWARLRRDTQIGSSGGA